ncbi:HDOD domain-containing protein [Massilia sp. DWR3-1-1]|uniref:HDOD domain-containing protein n=1 Tax=Massilia sp. DWR3-1-1 TaxID=2804559 RepID=UPI003CFA4FA6
MFQWLQRLFSASPGAAARPLAPPAPPMGADAAAPAAAAAAAAAVAADPAPRGAPRAAVSFDQQDRVSHLYNHWLFDTVGEAAFDTSELEVQVLDALAAIIGAQQSGAALVRRMPGMLPQLLQSLRSDNFSGTQLARTISADVVLVAAVIRMANSSLIGTGSQITSVEHAVMLIGQEGLRHLITSVAFRPIIDMHSGHYTRRLAPRIWDQSERVAVANRQLAEALGIDPFEAFLAGLVQHVGLIVALRVMDQIAKDDRSLGSELFCAELLRQTRSLTCAIGREWSFPDSVTLAIAEQGGMKKGALISPLGRLLTVTDYLGKLRILVEHERALFNDPALFGSLPPYAGQAYRMLAALDDALPAPATGAP